MKVLVVFHDSNLFSGATRSMIDLIESWLGGENPLTVAALFPFNGTASDYTRKIGVQTYIKKYYNIRIPSNSKRELLENIKAGIKNVLSNASMKSLSTQLKGERFDFIYSNTGAIYAGYYLSKELKINHIWHIREFGVLDQERKNYDGDGSFSRKMNESKKIIAISQAIEKHLLEIGVKKSLIDVVYDDVVVKTENCIKTFDDCKKSFVILSCGGIQVNKGHLDVIKAAEKLISDGYQVELKIAGNTNTPYYKILEEYVESHNLQNSVEFCGFVQNMNALRNKCDIGVVASYNEAFGRVTIEGMLSNMLMIGANAGGTPELIINGKNGFLYTAGDVHELVNCLASVIEKWPKMKGIIEAGNEFALRFNQGTAAKCIYCILNNIKA